MKRFLSVLLALVVLMSFAAISVSAAKNAETTVSVNKGDEVIYTLKLTVPEKVVGCDFSVYYDSSALQVKEVADFTGSYNEDDWRAVINPDIKDEVIGNWSILNGVKFTDNNPVVSVKFKAMKATQTHISYYVRYLYPESLEMFTDYKFTCDVTVNGKEVVDDAAPELNVDVKQPHGQFVNSVTGDSKDADVNTAGGTNDNPGDNGGVANEDTPKSNDKDDTNTSDKKDKNNKDNKDDDKNVKDDADDDSKSEATIGGADGPTDITVSATASQLDDFNIFKSVWLWAIVGIVLAGAAVAIVFVLKKPSNKDNK